MASLMYSGWSSAATGAGHGHGPRRSQDQNGSRKEQRSSSPDATTEPRRRSSSDVATTPRQTPAPSIRFLSTTSAQDSNKNILSSPISSDSPVKRLGFFTEKLSSSISGTSSHQKSHSPNSTQLLYPHRTEPSVSSAAPASATMSNPSKAHTSPSKVRCACFLHITLLTSHDVIRHLMDVHTTRSSSLGKCTVLGTWPISQRDLPPPSLLPHLCQ